jgi:hypothetical protein
MLSCYYAMDFKANTAKPLLRSTQHVQKLHERLKIIEENIPTDRRLNLAKRLGLAPSALDPLTEGSA